MSEKLTAYQLDDRIQKVKEQVNQIVVNDAETMQYATSFTKEIKDTIKSVEEYWKEPKQNANKAWKDICAREKEMAEPLKLLEKELKGKISDYLLIMEDEKRKKEEELKQITGFDVVLDVEGGKTKGLSSTDNYIITITDETLVPTSLNGIVLRKVDESAIKQLVKLAKGNIDIPGVKIERTKSVTIR